MKTILTLLFIAFIGCTAQAQKENQNIKVTAIKAGIVTQTNYENSIEKTSVARLYRYKNFRVKRELSFATKKSKPKMA